jgi:hypothetical protein
MRTLVIIALVCYSVFLNNKLTDTEKQQQYWQNAAQERCLSPENYLP